MVTTGAWKVSGVSDRSSFDNMIRIIRAEFAEMPGMHLTRGQFRRLWDLTEADCERLLTHLFGTGFLREGRQGRIGRPADV
jgi:hypothetical protein